MREMEEHAFDLSKEAVKLCNCNVVRLSLGANVKKRPSLKNCPLGPSVAGFCL
jgi:methylase of polypeptide subunit release factors